MLTTNFNTLLQFLLLILPGGCPSIFEPKATQSNFLKKFISNVHKEKTIETILILTLSKDVTCALKDFNSVETPIVRVDESTRIIVKNCCNSQALALVCMSHIADIILLNFLAKDINRMRDARIIIWLHSNSSTSGYLIHLISAQANLHSFLNLLVFDSMSRDAKGKIIAHRLLPFPKATLQPFVNINERPIFPKMHSNFYGKSAIILPDLIKPQSFLRNNSLTGKEELSGSTERPIIEFTNKFNITLQLHPQFRKKRVVDPLEILMLTMHGEIDLPIRRFPHRSHVNIEYLVNAELNNVFVVVPCGQKMCNGDILLYTGIRTYSLIVVATYFMFAVLETISVAVSHCMFGGRFELSYSSLFFNLRAFCGVLGLPLRVNRHRSSTSLQQIVMFMSLLGIILTCLFNVNLSTLLTKPPHPKQIKNFEDLRNSGLETTSVVTTNEFIEAEMDSKFFKTVIPKLEWLYIGTRQDALLALNTSYAYIIFTNTWSPINEYQKRYNLNILCESKGLRIAESIPTSGILAMNSVYKVALEEFIIYTYDMGLQIHWKTEAALQMSADAHIRNLPRDSLEVKSLTVKDFKWLWLLLGLCYTVSGLLFALEICIARWQSKRNKKTILCI